MDWSKILALIAIIGLIWLLYHSIKSKPDQFNSENLSKSFRTVGLLALLLIGFIALCVWLLKN